MTEFTYTVTHLGSATDITADVETVTVTEQGSGDINSCVIRLESDFGKYFTTTPKIDEFHKIRVQITDDQSNTFDKIYEVDNIIPIENSQEGKVIELECLGLEHHLQKFFFSKQFYFESAFDVVKDIIDQYNDTKGSLDPLIEDHDNTTGNLLPKWTANAYDFNIAEKKIYDGIREVVDRLGNTVQAGGADDFFEFTFIKGTADDKIKLRANISGTLPVGGSEVTITDTDDVNGDPSEGGIAATSGTVVASWGADDFGSLPPDISKFHGDLEAFALHPAWQSGVVYPTGARVVLTGTGGANDNKHYEKNIDTGTDQPPTNWTEKERFDILGTSEYSPWTNNKAAHWQNSGSNPSGLGLDGTGTGFDQRGMWDSNLVIWDNNHYRTRVDIKSTTDNFDVFYKYGQVSGGVYRGQRVLVNGTGINGFAGNDKFGKAFTNNIATYDGADWIVFRETSDDEQVSVIHEGAVYERQSGTWTDIHATSKANDCFHIYTSLSTNAGVNNTFSNVGHTTTYGDTSAIEVQYDYNTFLSIADLVFTSENYYKMGAWLCLRYPFPHNTYNSVPTLGELYGNNSTKKEPATLDANNMHLTHSGKVGFNNDEAEDLGPLSARSFAINLIWTDGLGAKLLEGDFKMRHTLYDTSDNVAIQDFTITFNDIWQDVSLPLSGYKIYRARIPHRWDATSVIAAFVLDDLDIVNVFEWKNIKQESWQWQEAYDDQGRFLPEGSRIFRSVVFTGAGRVRLLVDRVSWGKPLLAVTDPITTGRALVPKFRQQPLISNFVQLKQDALSWLEVAKFRHKQYDIRTEGRLDINLFDTFFLNKTTLVVDDDTRTLDTGGTINNIRLVCKKLVLKISKTPSESGHFIRILTGIKRIIS